MVTKRPAVPAFERKCKYTGLPPNGLFTITIAAYRAHRHRSSHRGGLLPPRARTRSHRRIRVLSALEALQAVLDVLLEHLRRRREVRLEVGVGVVVRESVQLNEGLQSKNTPIGTRKQTV